MSVSSDTPVTAELFELLRQRAAMPWEIEQKVAKMEIQLTSALKALEIHTGKKAPVQGYEPGIPWDMHMEAYAAYCKKYGKQQALIEGWCRGGFGCCELDTFIPGWRDELKRRHEASREKCSELKALNQNAGERP